MPADRATIAGLVPLKPDQGRAYQNFRCWREFRALFPKVEDALQAYANASQEASDKTAPTHELEWRFIFHNRESKLRQLITLALLPLGHIQTHHAEFRFKTMHTLSTRDVLLMTAGRAFGTLCYYLCFIGVIASGVGLVVSLIHQAFEGLSLKMALFSAGSFVVMTFLFALAAKTRSIGLSGQIKLIARDAFDLMSIKRLKVNVR
jgi:hypothetical protein